MSASAPSSSPSLTVSAGAVAGLLVALAIATSSIVLSEPAIADVLMLAAVVGVPILGAAAFGRVAIVNLSLWMAIVALGLAAVSRSTNFDTALTHQLVTLFLVLGGLVIAGYVAADPEPRFRLVMGCYVLACLIATAAAFAGYFRLVPSAYDLFTNYGRGRGTFKDPNVFGAAVVPAIVYCVWIMLREPARRALPAAAVALVLALGALISFSRGAWAAILVSAAIVAWVTLVRSRRRTDFRRLVAATVLGVMGLAVAIGGILQMEDVESLLEERASLGQSYDVGPEGRFGGQAKAMRLVLDNPLGIGTHTFRDTYHPEEPHNVYLSMFLNAGWLGGLLYIISVVITLAAGFAVAFRHTALQGPMLVATAAFAGLAFEGFVIDTDHWRHSFIIMGCVWGLADAVPPMRPTFRRRGDPVPERRPAQPAMAAT